MSLFERIKTINEKKYFPNTGDKKPKGILRNIGDYIRKTGADPMGSGDYGSTDKDFGKADKTKPQYRGGRTSQDFPTTKNIKKGSIPEPATILPPATVGGKSKPVKQSEVSKKAKQFTTKINKANVNRKEFTNKVDKMRRAAQRSIKRQFPGDKSGAYQAMKADIDSKNLIKKAGGSGDIGFTAPDRKTKVTKRTTRAVKQGTPDPFSTPTPKKPIRPFGDKPVTSSAPGFGKGMTPGQAKVKAMDKKAFKVTSPTSDLLPKSFKDFSKKLKTYRVDTDIDKKIKDPKLDISKVIKKRKSQTVQQTIPGTGGNRNIKKTYNKKTSRQKPPSGGGSSKYTQGSLFDKPSGSGSSGGGRKKGGPLVTTSKGIDPEVVQGRFSSNKELKDQEKKIRDALNKAREQGRAAGGGSGKPPKGPKVTTGGSGPFGMRPSDKMSGINPKAKVGLGKKVLRYIKNKPGKAALIGAVAVGAGAFAYDRIKKAISGPTLTKKDFTKTAPIQNRQGEKVTFKYARKNDKTKDKASPYLTSDALKKFKTGDYKVSTTSGRNINVNQNIKNSAFEKQLKRLEKNPEKNKKFLSTVKNATRPT